MFLFYTGLILVPNGESIGYALGDSLPLNRTETPSALGPRSSLLEAESPNYHPWGVFFTVLGTVFLDFDADACQSPARAYLLDVTVPGKICVKICCAGFEFAPSNFWRGCHMRWIRGIHLGRATAPPAKQFHQRTAIPHPAKSARSSVRIFRFKNR